MQALYCHLLSLFNKCFHYRTTERNDKQPNSGVKLRYFYIPHSANHCASDIEMSIHGDTFEYKVSIIL